MFLVVQGQDIPHALGEIHHYCLSPKHMKCHIHTLEISGDRHNSLPL